MWKGEERTKESCACRDMLGIAMDMTRETQACAHGDSRHEYEMLSITECFQILIIFCSLIQLLS